MDEMAWKCDEELKKASTSHEKVVEKEEEIHQVYSRIQSGEPR